MIVTILFLINIFSRTSSILNANSSISLMFLIVGLFFLVPFGIGFFIEARMKKREKLFRNFAIQNGWGYLYGEDELIEFKDRYEYRLFNTTVSAWEPATIYNLAFLPFENGRILVFDFYYYKTSSQIDTQGKMTVVAFEFNHYQLPYFSLYPEGFLAAFSEYFGQNDIDFPSHPNFSSRFKLSGKDENQIRQIFHPKVLNYFEHIPDLYIDVGGTQIFIYKKDHLVPIEQLNQFISEQVNVLNALRQTR